MTLDSKWSDLFRQKVLELSRVDAGAFDPAHDVSHFERVVNTARALCAAEHADARIVIPAAWLHDFINVPKDDPRRSQASRLSPKSAIEFLSRNRLPIRIL